MVSLTDIGKLTNRTIAIGGVDFPLHPISARSLVNLLDRFPVLKNVLAERKIPITADDFLKMGVEICAAIVVVGVGKGGLPPEELKKEEEAASEIGLGELGECIMKIIDVTFPKGFGPFLEFMERMQGDASADIGRGQATRSPKPSNSASGKDTGKPPGTTAPANSPAGPNSSTEQNSASAPT